MMDYNNYSYTAPGFGVDEEKTIASFEDFAGFGGCVKMTLEQWGPDRNKKYYVVRGFQGSKDYDLCVPVDMMDIYDRKYAYEKAARYYNECVPVSECIPLF